MDFNELIKLTEGDDLILETPVVHTDRVTVNKPWIISWTEYHPCLIHKNLLNEKIIYSSRTEKKYKIFVRTPAPPW